MNFSMSDNGIIPYGVISLSYSLLNSLKKNESNCRVPDT